MGLYNGSSLDSGRPQPAQIWDWVWVVVTGSNGAVLKTCLCWEIWVYIPDANSCKTAEAKTDSNIQIDRFVDSFTERAVNVNALSASRLWTTLNATS